jgi:Transposase
MNPQELSIELPAQGARRATGEGSKNGWQKPQRFSARQKTAVVLRLLRGEPLDLLSRELGIPAARLTTWREAFLDAGQEALKKPPLDSHDRELARVRQKLGEATMEIELLHEKIGRLETHYPLRPRRSRR